ncbi:K1C13 protein, partial [Polypterus senegalus]
MVCSHKGAIYCTVQLRSQRSHLRVMDGPPGRTRSRASLNRIVPPGRQDPRAHSWADWDCIVSMDAPANESTSPSWPRPHGQGISMAPTTKPPVSSEGPASVNRAHPACQHDVRCLFQLRLKCPLHGAPGVWCLLFSLSPQRRRCPGRPEIPQLIWGYQWQGARISSASVSGVRSSAGGFSSASGAFGSSAGSLSIGALNLESGSAAINASGKETMQNLNDRLASYLEKVRSLEEANAKLEMQIREWGESHTVVTRDVTSFDSSIEDLRAQVGRVVCGHSELSLTARSPGIHLCLPLSFLQILAASAVNSGLLLQIDNAKLAADDFRVKYENELAMRQSVEFDIAGLKKLLSDLTLSRSDLEMQIESVKDELLFLKKNHEEEMTSYRSQLSGQVQVEVDAAPSVDLNKVIEEIREQYEALATKNRRDAEVWFQSKAQDIQKQVAESNETLETSKTEIKEHKHTMQSLEIELRSLLNTKQSLEASLEETKARYAAQLAHLQGVVDSLEAQLAQMRADMERNAEDYRILLDIKTRLELEIAEYRRLLDGEEGRSSAELSLSAGTGEASSTTTKKVVTVVQEMVDGKVVSSSSSSSSHVVQGKR